MSTAVARYASQLPAMGSPDAEALIRPFLPEGVSYERVVAAAELAAQKVPALRKCTAQSVIMSVARIQAMGLEIGITAHLVPFGNECTDIPDYKGLAQLMIESGAVRHVETRCVYSNEFFEQVQGTESRLVHHPSSDVKSRGDLIGAYCILRLPFQQMVFEYVPLAEADAVRKRFSKQWKDGPMPPWWIKKYLVRQVSKLIPKSKRLARVMELMERDQRQEFGAISAAEVVDEDEVILPLQQLHLEKGNDKMLLEPTMALADAEAFIVPVGRSKGERVDSMTPVQMRNALLWTADNDTQPDFQLALATVLTARDKAEQSEAKGEHAGDGAPSDPPVEKSSDLGSPSAGAAPLSDDPYPDGTEGLTPGQLKTKALELLKHPALASNDKYITGTKQQLQSGLSHHQLRATVRTLESMIASAPVKGAKGEKRPHSIGELPGGV